MGAEEKERIRRVELIFARSVGIFVVLVLLVEVLVVGYHLNIGGFENFLILLILIILLADFLNFFLFIV